MIPHDIQVKKNVRVKDPLCLTPSPGQVLKII